MKQNRNLQDKIHFNLSTLTRDGAHPVTAEEIAEWLIRERDGPFAAGCGDAWVDFAAELRLNRGGKPDYKSRQRVAQVMTRMHNKCLCAQSKGDDGMYRWNCLRLQPMKAEWVGLPDFSRAYRISVRTKDKDEKASTEEYIVCGETAFAARSRLRTWLLVNGQESVTASVSLTVLEEIQVLM